MDIGVLEDLGLTEGEIKVYLALLELGSSTAGPIIEKSGLQNSVVHRALNSLIEKALINFVMEGRRHLYQATSPDQFFVYMDEKRRRFQEILPELKAKEKIAGKHEAATVYKGVRGINEIYHFMIAQKGEYNTFGGGEECAKRMGNAWWYNLHKKRAANKLKARQVFDETVRHMAESIESTPGTAVKYLTADFASFQETVIVGDYVAINVFTENPYGFLICDKSVADGYRKHFELLWQQART